MLFLVFNVLLALQADALPNVFQYEIEKAKAFVHTFEITNEDSRTEISKDYPSQEQRRVKLESFSWKDCSKSSSVVSIEALSISPDPLAFPGPLVVTTKFSLKKSLVSALKGQLIIKKKVLGSYIEIPCIDNFGSCTYADLCVLLSQIPPGQCPDPIKKIGINCSCPIKNGPYSLTKAEFDINASIIPSGEYNVVANITQSGVEAACLDIYLTVD